MLVTADHATAFASGLLRQLGASGEDADVVARSLIESDLRGHGSHGIRRLVPYAEQVSDGLVDPAARPAVVPGTPPAAVVVDGRDAFGQLTAGLGVMTLLERVPTTAVAVAVLRRCRHVGRLGEYVEALATRGLVGIAFANADPTVAPWGGRDRMLGTNPTAWAVPSGDEAAPLVVDFATSATAEGKLSVARDRGESVPPGLVLDAAGADSTDPADFYAGGALLTFGAHKGYGLSVAFDLVAGLLSRTGSASDPAYDQTFGTVLLALDVGAFVDLEDFRADVEAFRARIHASAPRQATAGGALVPGEPEWQARALALRDGFEIAEATRTALDKLADQLGAPTLDAHHPRSKEHP